MCTVTWLSHVLSITPCFAFIGEHSRDLQSHLVMLATRVAGPTGKVLLLPEDPNAVIIMVATGTGKAPGSSRMGTWLLLQLLSTPCNKTCLVCERHAQSAA